MACEGKTYHGLNARMMEAIRLDLQAMGMHMGEAHTGVVLHKDFGVEVEYHFQEVAGSLYVRITQKPFFVPCNMIYSRLDQAIARRQTGHDPLEDR